MEICYLLFGSNSGNRLMYLRQAADAVRLVVGQVTKYSSIYETEAWGFVDSTSFLNQVIEVSTNLKADELMQQLLITENDLGRLRQGKGEGYSSRTIDIDLLFYGQYIINEPHLVVPHPRLHQRRFTLAPLVEIAPGLIHPVFKKSIMELDAICQDPLKVVKFKSIN